MIIDISIAVIALAFLILVIYLAITLRALTKTLDRLSKTIQNVNMLTFNLNEKAQAFDSLFDALSMLGDKVRDRVDASCCVESECGESKDQFSLADWIAGGVRLWSNFKKRR